MEPAESFVLPSTPFVPNNSLPVLVYRDVLPKPLDEKTTTAFLEDNNWERKGLWTGTPVHHFHPNTHECYAVVAGETVMHLGRGQLDDPKAGRQVALKTGDVLVMPAGVAHMNITMSADYLFVGVYPRGSPRWTSQRCDREDLMDELKKEIAKVAIPEADPVGGTDGAVVRIWSG